MEFQKLTIREKFAFLFLSLGGIGKISFAPGTLGSLASLIYLYYMPNFPRTVNLFVLISIFIAAVKMTQYFENKFEEHDPSWIVIDEFLGMAVINLYFMSQDPVFLFGIFIMFRYFDIFKPWPVNWADQKLSNALGTILDDIFAGAYTILMIIFATRALDLLK